MVSCWVFEFFSLAFVVLSPPPDPANAPDLPMLAEKIKGKFKRADAKEKADGAAAADGGTAMTEAGVPPSPASNSRTAHANPEGKTYYHNKATGETVWSLPAGAVVA